MSLRVQNCLQLMYSILPAGSWPLRHASGAITAMEVDLQHLLRYMGNQAKQGKEIFGLYIWPIPHTFGM